MPSRNDAAEVAAYSEDHSLYRWMLEVSVSALYALLASWGEQTNGASLSVYCDASKPLYENRSHFDIMIGRADRKYAQFDDKLRPLIFNLTGPLQFVQSEQHSGIQIADVVASAAAYAFRSSPDEQTNAWKRALLPSLELPVLPDTELVDLRQPEGFVNAMVLRELVDRSLKGIDLFEGMPDFIYSARHYHERSLGGADVDSPPRE